MNHSKQTTYIDAEFQTIPDSGGPGSHSASFNPLAPTPRGANALSSLSQGDSQGKSMLANIMNVREHDQQFVQRDQGLLSRMFGKKDARTKRIDAHELAQTNTVCTYLEKELAVQCEAMYLRCQDDVNNWLARHRIASRRDLIDFATGELQSLKDTIEKRRATYTNYVRVRIERLQKNNDMGMLVEVEVADMQIEMREHLAFLRELELHFREAVKQRVG